MPGGWTRKRGSTWTWYIEDVPDPRTGRPRQVSKGGFRTRKEAVPLSHSPQPHGQLYFQRVAPYA